jgi:hypothetical protein
MSTGRNSASHPGFDTSTGSTHRATQCCRTKKLALQAKFDEEKAQLQQGKEQLLAEQLEVKEAVNRALRSVTIVEIKAEDQVTQQVNQLVEAIQQL